MIIRYNPKNISALPTFIAPMPANTISATSVSGSVFTNHPHIIDTVHGAEASAIIYSLEETAKANKLKIYEYLKHLLTEIPKHMDSTDPSFLDDLLPWSDKLPEECHKKI